MSVSSIAALRHGGVAVTHMLAHDLVLLDSAQQVAGAISLSQMSDSVVPGSQVLPLANGKFAIHWFGTSAPTWSSNWSEQSLPLVLILDSSGTILAELGQLVSVKGDALPAAINRGGIAISGDTLWFARYSDATIFAASLAVSPPERLSEFKRLPLFFHMRVPVEFNLQSTDTPCPQVESHLTGFAVTPDGRYFIVGQAVSWPEPYTDTLYRPRTVLTLYDRQSHTVRALDMNAEISRVVAGAGMVAVRATPADSGAVGVFIVNSADLGIVADRSESPQC